MRCTRIVADEDGGSHFDEIELPLAATELSEGQEPFLTSLPWPVLDAMFVTVPDADETAFLEWHHAPDPRLVVCLQGESIQQTTDGEERRFRAGDVFLTVDLTGRGHRSANRGTTSYLLVRLDGMPTT